MSFPFRNWPRTFVSPLALSACILLPSIAPTAAAQQVGFGWEFFQTSGEAEGGWYGTGDEVSSVETEDYVITVCRTVPFVQQVFPLDPTNGGNFLLYRRIDKGTETASVRVFEVGSPLHKPTSKCSVQISHSGDAVFIATNMTNGVTSDPGNVGDPIEEAALVLKVRINDNKLIWARRVPLDGYQISGIELERSQTNNGSASGYTVVGTMNPNEGGNSELFAFKIRGNGNTDWMWRRPFDRECTLTDADSHNDLLRWVGHERADVVQQRIDTDNGAIFGINTYELSNRFLTDPRIAMRNVNGQRRGFYMSCIVDDGRDLPTVMYCGNNGSVRWANALRDCDIPIGLTAGNSSVFVLARDHGQALMDPVPYRRFALSAGAGTVLAPDCIAVSIPAALPALAFEKGYESRPLISCNQFDSVPDDRWAVYKESAPAGGGGASYECPTFLTYETLRKTIAENWIHLGDDVELSVEDHDLEVLEPEHLKFDCGTLLW